VEAIKRRHLDSDAWRELLQRFAAGGESVSGFCRREGLSTNSFRRWRARLQGTLTRATAARPLTGSDDAAQFVDLGSLGVTRAVESGRLELKLDLGGGLSLHLVRG
jgi:putative transposase